MTYTPDQLASAILWSATEADSGCSHCACQVAEAAMRLLPDLPWREVWQTERDPGDDAWSGNDMNYFDSLFEEHK